MTTRLVVASRRALPALAAVGLVVALVGCGASPPATPIPAASDPTAAEVMARMGEAMGQVQSYRFTGDLLVQVGDESQQARLFGEWASPDEWRVRIEGMGNEAGQVAETVSAGGRVFARDSDQEGAWQEQDAMPPDGTPAPSNIAPGTDLEDLAILEEQAVSGLAAFHVTARQQTPTGVPTPAPGEQPLGPEVITTAYDLLIGKADYRLLRLTMVVDLGSAEQTVVVEGQEVVQTISSSQRVTWTFYDYDRPITVEPPEIAGG